MSNSFGNVYQKRLTEININPFFINAATYISLSILCIPFVVAQGVDFVSEQFLITAAVVGVLGALGNGFLVKALQNGELSVLGPINAYKSVFGLLFAFILLKEIPSLYGIVGIVLIIAGSYFVLDTPTEKFHIALLKNRSIHYRFLALLFCSLEAVYIKKLIVLSSVWSAFAAWCIFGAVFSSIILIVTRTPIKQEIRKIKSKFYYLINIVICIGVMQFTTNYAFLKMNVGYALAIFQLSALLSVILGYKIFHEKDLFKKIIGTLIMIFGAVMIILNQ